MTGAGDMTGSGVDNRVDRILPKMMFTGTTFTYAKKSSGKGKSAALRSLFAPEEITALGPTNEPIFIVVSLSVLSQML